jgi:hypothetical protein
MAGDVGRIVVLIRFSPHVDKGWLRVASENKVNYVIQAGWLDQTGWIAERA